MAERIVRQIIDDLDGSDITDGDGERIEFSLRGVEYQIDLSNGNVAKLEKALQPFVEAAATMRGSRGRGAKSNGNGRGVPAATTNGSGRQGKAGGNGRDSAAARGDLAAIRQWARDNGHEVSDRGRIKAEIVQAFEAAH